ncbi:MAG: SGNH/GDSL hydrolase family protein, partial [Oscillospiraceae bacterium]
KNLGVKSHSNVAVGSSVWYKRTVECAGKTLTTQDYGSADFAGISDGWEPTDDPVEMQKRMNNCAVVHIQRFLAEVKSGNFPAPDIFAFAMGTNDLADSIGDPEKALTGKELRGNENIDLFTEAGAARWCIQTIQENFPNCRIFVMTPIQTATPEHNRKIEKTIECLRKICRGLSVQVIDAYSNSGICEKFEVIGGRGRYLRDGLHPELDGQALEGAFATKEIRNNYF